MFLPMLLDYVIIATLKNTHTDSETGALWSFRKMIVCGRNQPNGGKL